MKASKNLSLKRVETRAPIGFGYTWLVGLASCFLMACGTNSKSDAFADASLDPGNRGGTASPSPDGPNAADSFVSGPPDGEVQPAFACASLGPFQSNVSQRLCFDFSDPSQCNSFKPEAGSWSDVDGSYHGTGPTNGQITCPGGPFTGTAMTTSVLSTLSATNVRLHARMTSMTRPDKVIVLRSQPSGNRIEVNFRSYFDMNDKQYGGDVVISALYNCHQVFFVLPDAISIPQYDNQPIAVDVQLLGQRLTISLDGRQIYDDTPTATDLDSGTRQLPAESGSVGFGVFYDGEVAFDDLIVEVLI